VPVSPEKSQSVFFLYRTVREKKVMRTKEVRFHLVLVLLFVTAIAACGGGGGGNGGGEVTSPFLDTSFGINGKVTTDIGTHHDSACGMAAQGDGKIVVAGYAHNGTN
jgi:hypothetical protein